MPQINQLLLVYQSQWFWLLLVLAALLPTLAMAADSPVGVSAPLPRSVAQARVALLEHLVDVGGAEH